MRDKYNSIDNLYKNGQIYNQELVVATEKLHGTNIRFGYSEGKFWIGGRNTILTEFTFGSASVEMAEVENDSYGFVPWFLKNYPEVPERLKFFCDHNQRDYTIYGEFVGPGIQKGVNYGPEKSFWVFDAQENGEYISWLSVDYMAKWLGLRVVPVVYFGRPSTEMFNLVYQWPSIAGSILGIREDSNTCEGVVIRPLLEAKDYRGNRVIVKHKNDTFSEKKSQPREAKLPVDATREQSFVETYVVKQRLLHVLQHLTEDKGIQTFGMKETGEVIQEMVKDLRKENEEEWNSLDPKILGSLVPKATVQLYKEYLND